MALGTPASSARSRAPTSGRSLTTRAMLHEGSGPPSGPPNMSSSDCRLDPPPDAKTATLGIVDTTRLRCCYEHRTSHIPHRTSKTLPTVERLTSNPERRPPSRPARSNVERSTFEVQGAQAPQTWMRDFQCPMFDVQPPLPSRLATILSAASARSLIRSNPSGAPCPAAPVASRNGVPPTSSVTATSRQRSPT